MRKLARRTKPAEEKLVISIFDPPEFPVDTAWRSKVKAKQKRAKHRKAVKKQKQWLKKKVGKKRVLQIHRGAVKGRK